MNLPAASTKSLLLVDDEPAMRNALAASFQREGWDVQSASGLNEAIRQFERRKFPVVITDVRMPDGDGFSVLREVRRRDQATAVVLLTAYGNVPQAVEAMRDGACDYLVKPVTFSQLRAAVERVLNTREHSTRNQSLSHPPEIIGSSPALRDALVRAEQAARSDADILIEAESGTGKELFARRIHLASDRRDKPFVALNCAAVPETLLESELFGHARGAFTGATGAKPGKFELAHGGTLLLDEIGEMPLPLQPKLLRVLQEREVDKLGDGRPKRVDVRVIATTNRSLQSMVQEEAFRADLFYRLNVIPLRIPPLRERREDIPALAEYFLRQYAKRPVPSLSDAFLAGLLAHDWAGNVRELANLMRRVAALCTEPVVGPEFLEPHSPVPPTVAPGLSLREAERRLLEMTLQATDGNRTRAAEMMGVSLRTIRNKIRDFGLPPRRYA